MNGNAFIFIASTKTGKTTLVTYLSEKGYPYISDDEVIINIDTLNVLVNIKPLHLRPESLPVLHNYGCSITGKEVNIKNNRRIVFIPRVIASGELPIGGLFFISRSESTDSCEDITKSESVQLFMQNLLSHDLYNIDSLKCAVQLAKNCKRLIYSDMRYVENVLSVER